VRHVHLSNSLVASEQVVAAATLPVFYLADHYGTVLLATDAAGAIAQNQRYAPFGLALDNAVPLDRYLGIERDTEMGLLHFGARFFAPEFGRFISVRPAGRTHLEVEVLCTPGKGKC
jgi:RHS repeat-associated protein